MTTLCLGFVYIPKLGSIYFWIVHQKFVQRCATKIGAYACKGSYNVVFMLIPGYWHVSLNDHRQYGVEG